MTAVERAGEAGHVHLGHTACHECAPPVSVLSKAHLLLGAFSSGVPSLGLTELSRRSGVPKASAHRLAAELVQLGYLARTPDGYQLGWRIFELGALVPGPAALRGVSRPALLDLRAATKAVIHLSVPHGADCVYLERLAGRRDIAVVSAIHDRVPSWRTASGRVLLAHGSGGPEAAARLGASAHDWPTGRSTAALATELRTIRERRWAEDRQQNLAGFRALAVPITHQGTDLVVAAVSATMPMDRNDERQVVHALWATAADISRGLGRPGVGDAVPAGPPTLVG